MLDSQKKYKIAGLGEVLWDIYDDIRHPGGAPANFAAHVALAGHEAILLSRVGTDAFGDELLARFQRLSCDVSMVQRDPLLPTGSVGVHITDDGQPQFLCSRDVAFDALAYDKTWHDLVHKVDAVLFGTLAQRCDTSRNTIQTLLHHAGQTCKIFDLNLRGWDERTAQIVDHGLRACQVVKLNEEELQRLQRLYSGPAEAEPYLRQLIERFDIRLAALTRAQNGCLLVTTDETVAHPGYPVRVVDTTGCGDAFTAGLIIQYLHGAPLNAMAEFADRLGAFVATRRGAVPEWQKDDLRFD